MVPDQLLTDYPHLKALAADLWDEIGSERERERAGEARLVLRDAAIAERVRSIVSSIGKLDPEWSPAEAYEHGQARLVLWILDAVHA